MKKTTNTTENNDLQVINKKIDFVINNDENNELTEKAGVSFREWLMTPQNKKKYVDRYGIIGGDWQIDIADVTEMIHVATTYDNLSGGMVDIIYLKFNNKLLNRIVYIDYNLRKNGLIPLPIDDTVQMIPFDFKYKNQRKTPTKKTTATDTTKTPTKTQTKTPTKTTEKTTEKTDKTTPTKTKTPKTENKKVVAK